MGYGDAGTKTRGTLTGKYILSDTFNLNELIGLLWRMYKKLSTKQQSQYKNETMADALNRVSAIVYC